MDEQYTYFASILYYLGGGARYNLCFVFTSNVPLSLTDNPLDFLNQQAQESLASLGTLELTTGKTYEILAFNNIT